MNKPEFYVQNKNAPYSSLAIAILLIGIMFVQLFMGRNPFLDNPFYNYIIVFLAFLVVVVDIVDLVKLRQNKIKLVVEDDAIKVYGYMFMNKTYKYEDMKGTDLRESDLVIYFNDDKKRAITGYSKSDNVRIMKEIKDRADK